MPYREVVGKPGAIPGLGPPPDDSIEWSVPIPWAALSIITEKIVRGCEYKIEGRFVEKPYGIRTFVGSTPELPEPFSSFAKLLDFGPGCQIHRVFAAEDPNVVLYWISIWGSLSLEARVDLEDELKRLDEKRAPLGGFSPDDAKSMGISSYLRSIGTPKKAEGKPNV
jgi:hypothetical protein